MANDFNDLNNPIGAVPAPISPELPGASGPDPYHSNGRDVYSKYGHRGEFRSDNPAYQQFLQTENQQDAAALYEMAVKWEIDKVNRQQQLAENKAILDEQREYDSPSARLARERQAGINSDIVGAGSGSGTGSGSSAQLVNPGMGEQENTTSFGNYYDDERLKLEKINTAFNGINSIASLASTVVGGFSSIVSSVSQLRLLPSQIRTNEANADLSSAQANEIESLLAGKEKRQTLDNLGIGIDNASKVLQQFASMREFLTADSDISPILSAMGVDSGQHDFYKSAFSELMKTPMAQARDNRAYVSSAQSAEERALYTSDYFNRMIKKGIELQELQLDFDIIRQSMDNQIQELLSNTDYTSDIANSLAVDASNQAQRNELISAQLERDAQVYFDKVDYLAEVVRKAMARQAELYSRIKGRTACVQEQAELDSLEALIPSIEQLGTKELDAVYGIERQIRRQAYLLDNNEHYDPSKGMRKGITGSNSLSGQDNLLQYSSVYFGDVVSGTHSSFEMRKAWLDSVLHGLGVISTVYAGYKVGTRPMSTGTVTTNSRYNRKTGQFDPTSRTNVETIF